MKKDLEYIESLEIFKSKLLLEKEATEAEITAIQSDIIFSKRRKKLTEESLSICETRITKIIEEIKEISK